MMDFANRVGIGHKKVRVRGQVELCLWRGISISFDDDVGVAESAGELADLLQRAWDVASYSGLERIVGSKEIMTALVNICRRPLPRSSFISASGLKVGCERSRTSL